MASEYLKWLAKDVKPAEKRELTKQEKAANWWHYHKWYFLVGAVVLLMVASIASDVISARRNQPDYSVAYVGSSYLPEDTVTQLTDALALLGEDLNGNGKVQVALHQYILYPAEGESASMNHSLAYSGQVQLAADLENGDSFFFLMDDPRRFQEDFQILVYPDGSFPEEGAADLHRTYLAWADCPVLTGLTLGSYTVEGLDSLWTGDSQALLSGLYIGRRGFWQGESGEHLTGCEKLWNTLLQGAAY